MYTEYLISMEHSVYVFERVNIRIQKTRIFLIKNTIVPVYTKIPTEHSVYVVARTSTRSATIINYIYNFISCIASLIKLPLIVFP